MFESNVVRLPSVRPSVFWGEAAPAEHLVQFYQSDDAMLDALEGFVAGGITAGESVVIIVTPPHMAALNARLGARGLNVQKALACDQYIPLDAENTLAQFMVDKWPDEHLFQALVHGVLARARKDGRRVRAFGEMVAILWGRGDNAATVRLEHLWNEMCKNEKFYLFCAYPQTGFTEKNATDAVRHICSAHSMLVA